MIRIGVDLGGTKIEAVALEDRGAVLARQRVATPRDDYAETLNAIVRLVDGVEQSAGGRGSVGTGIPGAVVPATGFVKNSNSLWLNGKPLIGDLEQLLDRPVRAANDANCFAISEAHDGGGAGAEVVFGVILGTGVGGGIVVRGQPLTGPNLVAGEWGHNQLPWMTADELPGPACYCGRCGCIESFLSGPGFAADYTRATSKTKDAASIVADAQTGDADALAALARYHHRLARALAGLINILDPDVIVLGGGMSNLPNLADTVTGLLPPYVFSDSVVTRIVRNVHGDSSGVRGAAWLWPAGA